MMLPAYCVLLANQFALQQFEIGISKVDICDCHAYLSMLNSGQQKCQGCIKQRVADSFDPPVRHGERDQLCGDCLCLIFERAF